MKITKDDVLMLKSILDRHSREEKHIGYHILPERFNLLLSGSIHENHYVFRERERFSYFKKNVDFNNKDVIDIGCNIGYFLFSILDSGANQVVGYEGKRTCGEFINKAISLLDDPRSFAFINDYYQFGEETAQYDVGLLLNVLHHLGDDYGSSQVQMDDAKPQMLEQLNKLSSCVGTLIFQMGFNWKGNRNTCLFSQGTKAEMIDFIRTGTDGFWDIVHVGIAERGADGNIAYRPLDANNIARDDSLGEFLNRPIFILRAK